MIWFLAAIDLAAGAYLLVYAHRRERRDKPGVLAGLPKITNTRGAESDR